MQLTVYDNEFLSKSTSLSMSRMGARGAPNSLMAQSQCWRSVEDTFWTGVVIQNKESLNNRSNNPNKSGAVTLSEIFYRILTRFCRKIVGWASDGLRLHRRWLEMTSAGVFSFNWKEGFLTRHSLLQQEGLKLLAIRSSEAPLYTRRFTTIPPYDSSETITERVRVVTGRRRFSRRSPETTRRHWISTWICNPTKNLATSLRLFGRRLRLIGGYRRSSESVSGMPKMGEKYCEQSYNFNFKDWDRDGCGDT